MSATALRVALPDNEIGGDSRSIERTRIEKALAATALDDRFVSPAVALPIRFRPFRIDRNASGRTGQGFLPSVHQLDFAIAEELDALRDSGDAGAWGRAARVDAAGLARFLPLLRGTDGSVIFHPPHVGQLMGYLAADEGRVRMARLPSGEAMRMLAGL